MTTDFSLDVATVGRIEAVPKILEVACRITGLRFAAVARVTEERWITCAVRDGLEFGLVPGAELDIATTLCNEVRDRRKPIAIDHVAESRAFRAHPTPAMYGFQSYISIPIFRVNGSFFGTLCALDPRPARVDNAETVGAFTLFAELIALHLDAQERLAASEAALSDAHDTARLREEFIAVLGHDLRNPLASITSGALVLSQTAPTPQGKKVIDVIQRSVSRMTGLIDDVMDFARARLGGGISVERRSNEPLGPILQHVVDELRSAYPQRDIESSMAIAEAIDCDPSRLSQLLSNLLANALVHGATTRPIRVTASAERGVFTLEVVNAGEAIPPVTLERLFLPYTRASAAPNRHGLGLGLYIASEIARAHGGVLRVTSDAIETRFTFRMPTTFQGTA